MNQKIFEKVVANLEQFAEDHPEDIEIPEGGIKSDHDLANDLGVDSLDQVEIIMDLEKEFNVFLSDDECGELHTVEDLVNLIEKHLPKSE